MNITNIILLTLFIVFYSISIIIVYLYVDRLYGKIMFAIFFLLLFIYLIYTYAVSPERIPLDYLVSYLNIKNGSVMDFTINVRGITGEDCNISGSYDGNTYNITSNGELEKCTNFNSGKDEALNAISSGYRDSSERLRSYYQDYDDD